MRTPERVRLAAKRLRGEMTPPKVRLRLAAPGVTVQRIPASDVLADPDEVAEGLARQAAAAATPLHRRRRHLPRFAGEAESACALAENEKIVTHADTLSGEPTMKIKLTLAAAAAAMSLAGAADAGCLGGAAVGGVAGHFAGHHALLGAAAGCAVGHFTSHRRHYHHGYYR